MKGINIKKNKGFALLFSVLIASLLLTIGLSILSIALKELDISSATERSIHAFYAADSGVECVKYWDLKHFPPQVPPKCDTGPCQITCGSISNLSLTFSGSDVDGFFGTDFFLLTSDTEGPNFNLSVTRDTGDLTTVKSYGRDTAGGDRVERAIKDTY
jgi:hypothetical protein